MKIVVIGGIGFIGSRLVSKARADGHRAVAAAPDTCVKTLAGEGFNEAVTGARAVVDVSNSPSFDDAAVLTFLEGASSGRGFRKQFDDRFLPSGRTGGGYPETLGVGHDQIRTSTDPLSAADQISQGSQLPSRAAGRRHG